MYLVVGSYRFCIYLSLRSSPPATSALPPHPPGFSVVLQPWLTLVRMRCRRPLVVIQMWQTWMTSHRRNLHRRLPRIQPSTLLKRTRCSIQVCASSSRVYFQQGVLVAPFPTLVPQLHQSGTPPQAVAPTVSLPVSSSTASASRSDVQYPSIDGQDESFDALAPVTHPVVPTTPPPKRKLFMVLSVYCLADFFMRMRSR